MALILPRSRFLHTPKTGGTWVNRAVSNALIPCTHIGGDREHIPLLDCAGPGLFTIAFVRHPWTWWKSYWVFKQKHGWDAKNPFDQECRAEGFEWFLAGVLDRRPGHCSRVFELFTGSPDRAIEFIGRFEYLVDDLILGLSLAGEQFDEAAVRATPAVNVGDYDRYSTVCSPEIRARILEAEAPALERFGYADRW
jgi:hypothetical protein